MYTKIYKIRYCSWQNWIQMENHRYLKSMIEWIPEVENKQEY
jgi:hypothetical protein